MDQGFNPYSNSRASQPYFGGASPMGPTAPPPFPIGAGMNGVAPYPPRPMPPQTGLPVSMPPAGALGATGQIPAEQSYIENILRLNKGKLATVYATFEKNTEWNAKIFKGIIEAAGQDYLILSSPETGQRILLPMTYLNYVTFDEELEYEYPFGVPAPNLGAYPPR